MWKGMILPVKSKTCARMIFIAFVIALVQLTTLASFAGADSSYIEILDIDEDTDYAKEVSAGQNATYYWTLRHNNLDNITYDIVISISSDNPVWGVQLTPASPIIITPGDAEKVTLTVSAPLDKDKSSTNVTMIFEIEQNGAPVQREKRYTLTSLTGTIKPEQKKIFGQFDNPLPSPLDNEWGVFILTLVIWLGISFVLVLVLDPCVKSVTKKTKTELDDIILRIVKTPLLVLVFFYGFVSSLAILEEHIPEVVIDLVNSIYGIALVLIIFYVVYKLFKDILVYYGGMIAKKTSSNIDDIIVPIVEKFGVVIIALVALGYKLGYLDVDLSMFIAGGVVISMVIAFAAQETLSNFFSGIFILTDRPFQEGDTIILPDGDWYKVRKIGLRSTRLFRFKDAALITIPNNGLANEKITNFSNPEDKTRLRLNIGVAYGTDPEKVKNIILDAVSNNENIITDDENMKPYVRFTGLGESSIDFLVQVNVHDRGERVWVADYLYTEIYKRFEEEAIEIPFPQRVIHLKKDEG